MLRDNPCKNLTDIDLAQICENPTTKNLIAVGVIKPDEIRLIYSDILERAPNIPAYNLAAVKGVIANLNELYNLDTVKNLLASTVLSPHNLFEIFRYHHGKESKWGFFKNQCRYNLNKTLTMLTDLTTIANSEEVTSLKKLEILQIADIFNVFWQHKLNTMEVFQTIAKVYADNRIKLENLIANDEIVPRDIFSIYEQVGLFSFPGFVERIEEALALLSTNESRLNR